MKVLIHVLGAKMGGALRHLTNFILELAVQDKKNEYEVYVSKSFPCNFELSNDNIKIVKIDDNVCEGWFKRILFDIIFLPLILKKEKFDIIVSLANFGPIWTPCKHVNFQRNSIFYCDYYLKNIKKKLLIEALFRRCLAVMSMKKADLIVTPSNAMSEMIKRKCKGVRDKNFMTIYHGHNTYSTSSINEEEVPSILINVKTDSRLKFFYPTHPAPHKGFDILFKILRLLKEDGSNIVLYTTIEHNDWPEGVSEYEKDIQKLDLQENVVFMGRISQKHIIGMYKDFDAMLYPSLCESFGFSMIEALDAGIPVVAADTPVNREILGEAAIYYSPLNPFEGYHAVKKVINNQISKSLIKKGKKRVESFDWSWGRYTREFCNMIENLNSK